ncbi:MAG: sigma-70 family RNA polymerase sigma factor [Bacteroidetes bacterium]|jgi:RNA polymerase sigma factor (sigma-70 family)|nr:sigma-70 family RNA polymerase sigma factor [Bacteroidota bacterium]MBK9556184.1 sigma-70 family RNA polymerase sigma factor [Bacteroidota bacterium]MBL0278735.1 sigma-70 family RNA polymerase sigma factor [Bacteroidota bacterium]
MSNLSDEELLSEYKRSGESKYAGELFKRYAHLVLGVCMKYLKNMDEAQDTTMFVFEKLLSELRQTDVQHFKSWLYMVAKNQCLMHIRKQKRHDIVTFDTENGENEESNSMEIGAIEHLDDVDLKEVQLQQLEEGIKTLNHEQQECISLFYLQDKSYVEVAEITGYDLNKVKSYIQNGKRNLKIYLEKRNV